MIRYYQVVRNISARIGDIADRTIKEILEHNEQEPNITAALAGRIRDGLDQYRRWGIRVTAQVLNSSGRGSQEHRAGADLLGILSVNLPDFQLSKGFFVQAKKITNGTLNAATVKDAKEKCAKMLAISPDSYLFTYSSDEIRVIPASSIIAVPQDRLRIDDVYSRSLARFYEIHLTSFVGDPKLGIQYGERVSQATDRIVAREPKILRLEMALAQ